MFATKSTSLFNSIFNDDLWKDLETSTSLFAGYHSEKTDDGYVLELAVPGLTKEDLSIKIVKGYLKIENKTKNIWNNEFSKSFIMPNDVNEKNVKATVENGVLKVTMSVKKESENVIQIL